MAYGTFLKFHHKIDIYSKTTQVNAAGQRSVTFEFSETIPVFAQQSSSESLNNPYVANFEQMDLFVPKQYLDKISYSIRLKDLKDRYNNIIDESYFEIIAIQKKMQFSGKVHHITIGAKKVVEND
jgi:hypothetical protein